MLSQRAVSGVKLLGIGSLGLFSSAVLFLGMFIALLMWAPWWLALKVFDVPTLDVFRIFYASSYTVLAPALLFGGATGFALSTIIAKKSKASKKSIFYVMLSVVFVGLFVAGAFVPSVTAISATQQAEYNQFNEKPCSFYVFTDGTNSYAQNCDTGVIAYGGPSNIGGATGTDTGSVVTKAISALPAAGTAGSGGTIQLGIGIFLTTSRINVTKSFVTIRGSSAWGDPNDLTSTVNGGTTIRESVGPSTAFGIITLGDGTNSYTGQAVEDITLDGNGFGSAVGVNQKTSASDCLIENVMVARVGGTGISLNGGLCHISNVWITNSPSATGLDVESPDNIVSNIRIEAGFNNPNNKYAILERGSHDFYTNIFIDGSSSFTLGPASAISIVGGQIIGAANAGLVVTGANGAANNIVISGLWIQGNGVSAASDGMTITQATNVVVTNCIFSGDAAKQIRNINDAEAGSYAATNNLYANNRVSGATTQIGTSTKFGNQTRVFNNVGYNPTGAISNFVFSGGSCTGCGTFFSPFGTTATVANSTTYTIANVPMFISYTVTGTMTGGQTTVIKVDGTQVLSQASLTAGMTFTFTLQPGQTFYITYHTGKGTFVVSGE